MNKWEKARFDAKDFEDARKLAQYSLAEFLQIGQRDSRVVLKAIEAQHGLLIERSQKVWTFSHLTFQEYLVSKCFLRTCDWNRLAEQVVKPNWREVFLLTTESFLELDDLLLKMKVKIDQLLADDRNLQKFLDWLNLKSSVVKAPYKPSAIRAFYFTVATASIDSFDTIFPKKLAPALFLDLELMRTYVHKQKKSLNSDFSIACTLDSSLNEAIGIVHGHGHNFHDELMIPREDALHNILERLENSRFNYSIEPEKALKFAMALAYDYVLPFPFYEALQSLKKQLSLLTQSYIHSYNKYWKISNIRSDRLNDIVEECNQKWLIEGKSWNEELKLLIVEHRGIKSDLEFHENQLKLLQLYYLATGVLVSCLNNTCTIKEETIKIVDDYLFLPIAEIEKRKREKSE